MTDPRLVRMDAEDARVIVTALRSARLSDPAKRLSTAYSEGITEEEAKELTALGARKTESVFEWRRVLYERAIDKVYAAFTQEDS